MSTLSKLQTIPIELSGELAGMFPDAALQVVERMRHACLDGVGLSSNGQPIRLRVDLHTSGPPAIWLHAQPDELAWIIVDISPRDWSKLAYQFGHELGHVVANSWRPNGVPARPCQWLEEALVEAFSLRGLGRLADEWSRMPLFAGDSGFGTALAIYRQNMIESYGKLAIDQGYSGNLGLWFKNLQSKIEEEAFLSNYAKVASLVFLAEYNDNPACLAGLGALNCWPDRAAVPLASYLWEWETHCRDLGVSTALPVRLRELLQ